jgi:hypothetical protein
VYALKKGVDVMEYCASDTAFLSLEGLTQELDAIYAGTNDAATIKTRVAAIDAQLTVGKVDWTFWSQGLLEALDETARRRFVKCYGEFGLDTEAYTEATKGYVNDVMTLFTKHHPNTVDHPRLAAKFKWLMLRPGHFPVVTSFLIDSMVHIWDQLGDALHEVSCNSSS